MRFGAGFRTVGSGVKESMSSRCVTDSIADRQQYRTAGIMLSCGLMLPWHHQVSLSLSSPTYLELSETEVRLILDHVVEVMHFKNVHIHFSDEIWLQIQPSQAPLRFQFIKSDTILPLSEKSHQSAVWVWNILC
jgi:hypothetical protein